LPRRQPCGPPESGRAHLAAAAANTLVACGRAVLFATAPEFLAMIRDRFNAGQTEELTEVCQRVSWRVIDDLGAERLTDWAAEVLFRMFKARYYTARAHTLVVSNVRPEEVPEARLSSRFLDVAVCQVVPNGGEDYRRHRKRIRTSR
jgi:DNA replication protein DnaC